MSVSRRFGSIEGGRAKVDCDLFIATPPPLERTESKRNRDRNDDAPHVPDGRRDYQDGECEHGTPVARPSQARTVADTSMSPQLLKAGGSVLPSALRPDGVSQNGSGTSTPQRLRKDTM